MDSPSKSFNMKKHLKEEFVSNLGGSSMIEIAALSAAVPLLFVLRHSICFSYKTGSAFVRASAKKDGDALSASKSLGNYLATVTVDFMFIVLPILLFLTVLAEWIFILPIFLMVLTFSITAKRVVISTSCSEGSLSLRAIISSYRVVVMVVTCLCILAVDFRIYPRRYAKTETYGYSLMDLGVGSFVLANSLVSRQARNASLVNLKAAVQSASPLLLLGFGRLLSTTTVDYQVTSLG